MPDVLVRGVPEETLAALKQRAKANRRSLQQEVLSILEVSAREARAMDPVQVADAIRRRLARSGRSFGDSVPLVQEDRAR
jgi:plasmid stability protein